MTQRFPVIFWLLVAATAGVTAVALVLLRTRTVPFSTYPVVACDALLMGLIGAVCVWSALHPRRRLATRIAPLLAVVAAGALITQFSPLRLSANMFAYYGLHAAMLLTALWLLKRTTFWQQRTGAIVAWQFSVGQLLVVMTVVAVLIAALRRSEWMADGWLNVAFIAGCVLLAVVAVVSWSLRLHWLMRLACVCGTSIVLGFMMHLMTSIDFLFPFILGTHYLIQSLVLSAWLGLGSIMPPVVPAATGGPPAAAEPAPRA